MSIVNVNNDNFKEEVLDSKMKVLVDFNAEWCGPCKMIGPILEEISNENDNIKIVSINVDDNGDLAKEYNVFSIPCLVLIENGKEIKRSVGLISKDQINDLINE